jgi:hypothetical protein
MFSGDGSPGNPPITAPTMDQMLGTWIPLSPSTKPPPRTGASFVFDRAHQKYYLQGGFGCLDTQCSTPAQAINDLWAYSPPNFNDPAQCNRTTGICTQFAQGTWTQIRANLDASNSEQPTQRKGAVIAYGVPQFTHGDEYYTITDSACVGQGPVASADVSVNKELVGAIYIDVDRSVLAPNENLLINLRFLPFDQSTKLPGFFDNNDPNVTVNDTDASSIQDQALIRVQMLNSPLKEADQIQASIQPRFHEFLSGTPIVGDTFLYVSGATGQVTEKQIHVPISLDSTVNLIKIERIQGSVKFYEMTVSRF